MLMTIVPNLEQLAGELAAAGVVVNALGTGGSPPAVDVYTYDGDGAQADLPPAARPVLDDHVPAPRAFEVVENIPVSAVLRTTDELEHDVFVLPAATKSVYRAELEMSALDAGNGACKFMAGILVWKRLLGANVIAPPANITVVSQINDTAAASWIMNGLPSGGSFRVFVKGAAGRTIDWALVGNVARYAPAGLEST